MSISAWPLWRGAPVLSRLASGRDNNFNLLRVVAASLVIFAHSWDLGQRTGQTWVIPIIYNRITGNYPVQLFLIISGFLVSRSFVEREHLGSFFAARGLRIYPALLAAVLLSLILGAASSTLPLSDFLRHADTVRFVLFNAVGYCTVFNLPEAYPESFMPGAGNGPLWTLPVELNCYVLLAAVGSLGALRKPAAFTVIVAALAGWFVLFPGGFPAWVDLPPQLLLAFTLGSAAYVWRDRIRVSIPMAMLLVLVNALVWSTPAAPWLFTASLAYWTLVLAYARPLYFAPYNRLGDYSYGLYVYAFPLQQTFSTTWKLLEPLPLFALSMAATLTLAMLSWRFIEHPALRLKWRATPTTQSA
jgi:peptidoglycan/LPS O-acetylase OafA/YrhL